MPKNPIIVRHRIEENRRPRFPRLGRHINHDPRSRKFAAQKAGKIKSVTHKPALAHVVPLDQGNVGACTAFASVAALSLDPFGSKLGAKIETSWPNKFALSLYHAETELTPEEGIYPPEDPGGSGLAVAKALKNLGLIKSYRHAFGIDHALKALVKAPVIVGMDWYSSFDDVDPANGLVEIKTGARVEGGHEVCAFGIDLRKKLVWFWQSWGNWGFEHSGQFCMKWNTLDFLLQNQGDVTQFSV